MKPISVSLPDPVPSGIWVRDLGNPGPTSLACLATLCKSFILGKFCEWFKRVFFFLIFTKQNSNQVYDLSKHINFDLIESLMKFSLQIIWLYAIWTKLYLPVCAINRHRAKYNSRTSCPNPVAKKPGLYLQMIGFRWNATFMSRWWGFLQWK